MPRESEKPPVSVSLNHILCSYRGAQDALKRIKLSRDQARIRAGHLLKLARAKDTDFADLVRKFSDDPRTSRDGGDLGAVNRGQLHPDLERAAFGLGPDQVSEVVESPRGFHILKRRPPTEAQVAEILVTYTGAKHYSPRKSRDRARARALAGQVLERLREGASFEAEAITYSDMPNYSRGGFYPIFAKGTRLPKFEQIVWNLAVGEMSDIVETKTGFHIVKRLPVQRIQVRHVLIEYQQAPGEPAEGPVKPRLSYQEAAVSIEEVHRLASQPGADFAQIASIHSDGHGRQRGGLMESFGRGRLPYAFEAAAFALNPGEISKIVETTAGFHVIKRVR
jgi:peptidyl-prolyl cis-trans isomerase SurA